MYLIVERKKFDNLPIERKYLFIVKSYEIDYHTARKKKEAFETINNNNEVCYQIVSFVDKATQTKVA